MQRASLSLPRGWTTNSQRERHILISCVIALLTRTPVTSYCAVRAIIDSVQSKKVRPEGANVNVIMCFNHEEIGSVSTTGAASSVALSLLERLSPGPGPSARSIAHSFLISSDVVRAAKGQTFIC